MRAPETLFVHSREGRLRTPWRLLAWFVAIVVAGTVGAAIQTGLAASAPTDVVAGLLTVVGAVALYVLLGLATVTVAHVVDRRDPSGLGLGGSGFRRSLAVGLALGVAMTTVVFLVGRAGGMARVVDVLVLDPAAGVVPGASVAAATLSPLGPLAVVALLVPFFVAVGVVEEILVRGYLLTNLAEGLSGIGPVTERGSIAIAVAATSGLFGALHLANPHAGLRSAAAITAIGVVFGWTYAVTGDLGIPIGVHVTWNLTLAAVWGFPVSGLAVPASVFATEVTGPALVTGGAFGPEAGLVMAVPLALAVLVTAWWTRQSAGGVTIQTDIARFAADGRHATGD